MLSVYTILQSKTCSVQAINAGPTNKCRNRLDWYILIWLLWLAGQVVILSSGSASELILGFVEKGPTPPPPLRVFPKGGQPANQMGNGVFFKKTKKQTRQPALHPLKKLSPRLKNIEQGLSLGNGLFCSTPTTITLAFKSVGQRQREKSGRGVWFEYKQM